MNRRSNQSNGAWNALRLTTTSANSPPAILTRRPPVLKAYHQKHLESRLRDSWRTVIEDTEIFELCLYPGKEAVLPMLGT